MRHRIRTIVLALCLSLMLVVPMTAQASAGLDVINHVFTSRVIQSKDGGFYPQDTLIGFERGTASFHTVTQVALQAGTYTIRMDLKDPSGKTIASKSLPTITAQHDDWSQALWVEWPSVQFSQTGRHELSIVLDGKVLARFFLLVS